MVFVENLNDSSVDIRIRVWAKSQDYWSIWVEMTEKVKAAFDENGISIPFPQRDIHLFNNTAS